MKVESNQAMGLKIGDIVCGTTHWYCTRPYFYEVIGFKGKTQVELRGLHKVYETHYGSNSPLYFCIPEAFADKIKSPSGEWLDVCRNYETSKTVVCNIVSFEKACWEKPEDPVRMCLKIRGDKYGPLLSVWDEKPVAGNCD